jgi:hypothetical protein
LNRCKLAIANRDVSEVFSNCDISLCNDGFHGVLDTRFERSIGGGASREGKGLRERRIFVISSKVDPILNIFL